MGLRSYTPTATHTHKKESDRQREGKELAIAVQYRTLYKLSN